MQETSFIRHYLYLLRKNVPTISSEATKNLTQKSPC